MTTRKGKAPRPHGRARLAIDGRKGKRSNAPPAFPTTLYPERNLSCDVYTRKTILIKKS